MYDTLGQRHFDEEFCDYLVNSMPTYSPLQSVSIPICIDSDDLIYSAIHPNGARRERRLLLLLLLSCTISHLSIFNQVLRRRSIRGGREGKGRKGLAPLEP